jgi:hypothetical protein
VLQDQWVAEHSRYSHQCTYIAESGHSPKAHPGALTPRTLRPPRLPAIQLDQACAARLSVRRASSARLSCADCPIGCARGTHRMLTYVC